MVFQIEIEDMRPVIPEWYNEIYAVHKLGWKWMSWVGIPIKGTKGYPKEMRVRQLLSPEQLSNERWIEFLKESDGREADGTEPLSYTYCSSACNAAIVPDLVNADLMVDLSRFVHDQCEDVPHDIGIKLAEIVRKHFVNALRGDKSRHPNPNNVAGDQEQL